MSRKKYAITAVGLAIILLFVGATIYGWVLDQRIFQTTFGSKAGVDYWSIWTLENNLFTASILLTLLSMITLPQRSTFLSLLSRATTQGPELKKLGKKQAVIWRLLQAGGLFFFYVSSGGFSVTGQNVAFLLLLMSHGSISINASQVRTLFTLPFAPGTSAEGITSLVPALEAYQLYLGLVSTFIVATGIRIGLTLLKDLMAPQRDEFVIAAKGLSIGSLILILQILAVPMWTVNAGTWMSYLALIIALGATIVAALAFLGLRIHMGDARQRMNNKIQQLQNELNRLQNELVSLRNKYEAGSLSMEDYRKRVNLLMQDRNHVSSELNRLKLEKMVPFVGSPRSFTLLTVFLVLIVALLPIVQGLYYGIQMEGDKYIDWKFNYETKKEIAITQWASGIQNMQTTTLDDLTSNATPSGDVDFLTTVRQWDQQASYLRMRNQIGTNWMELADSDIVYLRNHEYWMAPLTFDYGTITSSFINKHLIYTHTEGLVVLDAYSGDLIEDESLVALLNRSNTVATYYGEGTGFQHEVFVNTDDFDEVGNTTFQGTPDYRLRGLESVFYTLRMGTDAWSFIGQDLNMLVERNVASRVKSVLLQGLTVDDDAYIVVDPSGNIYYGISVFIDYPLTTGYAHENYLRFLGVVLVDADTGDMDFYKSPSDGDDFFIDRTYSEYYPWQDIPSWLQSQTKWPEDLYERQLDIAYTYHVENGFTWKSGNDFHESPTGSDTRYIIMRIGGEERFVAMHNAEFENAAGENLAGIYVMGCGDKSFGELSFYGVRESGLSKLLGPGAAVQAFETNDAVRSQLQLWGSHRYGNRLVYHLGGDLFYVVPVFLEVETSTNVVIEKLGGVGLVDAETGERVELGENVIEAYYDMFGLLNQTVVEEGEVGFEDAAFNPITVDSGDYSELVLGLRNNDNVTHNLSVDITVVSGNFSVLWHGAEVTPTEYPSNTTFTLDIGTVGPGDLYGTSPLVAANLPAGVVFAQYLVVVTLKTEEGVVDQTTLFLTVT
jgi:hypothetical protein